MSRPNPLVVIDPEDSIETVRGIRKHFTGSSSLVIAVPPKSRSERELNLLILKALGKRLETSRRDGDLGAEVARWLPAHGFRTIIFLCAEHLHVDLIDAACERLRVRDIASVLVFGRTGTFPPTTTLPELLATRTPLAPAPPADDPWPKVPRCHPLIFRYRCDTTLPGEDALRVTRLLNDCWFHMHWRHWDRESETKIGTELAVLTHAEDPNEAIIRHTAAEIVLIPEGLTFPAPVPLRSPGSPNEALIDLALTETDPIRAAIILAHAVTKLPRDLLRLVHADQLLRGRILGIPTPRRAQPIIAALEPGSWLGRGPYDDLPLDDHGIAIERSGGAPRPLPEIHAVLEWLLSHKGARAAADTLVYRMTQNTIDELNQLCLEDVLYRDQGAFAPVYGLTDRAAYSAFLDWVTAPKPAPSSLARRDAPH
jgi:hypothetical protein